MTSWCNDCRQQLAIIRRYGIIVMRTPFRSCLRILVWPSLIVGLVVSLLVRLSQSDPENRNTTLPTFIMYAAKMAMFLTVFHVYSFGEQLVKDKATGMKSLMISSGLKRWNYYMATSICSLLYLLPASLIIAVITKEYLFDSTVGWSSTVLVLMLFALHLDAIMYFLVSFITSPSYSFIIPLLIFLESFINVLAEQLITRLGDRVKSPVLFMVSLSPYQAIRLFYNDYLVDHGIKGYDQILGKQDTLLNQDLALVIGAQIFWTIFFRLFACWFEEVCPWQTVSAVQGVCFCFERGDDRYDDGAIALQDRKDNPFFEPHAINNKDIGIQVANVTKRFNNAMAVNDVTFTIYKGETTLLLGHNGAGKSTLMNMILGMLRPDKGKVRVRARSRTGAPASIGICPQASVLDDDLNVRQHLELFNDIKSGITGQERQAHVKLTLDEMSLSEHAAKQPQELSGGMKRKLSLGIAFVGRSEVLILDEPSSGLDPDSRMFVWNAIRRYRTDRTVLLSTQHMEEADYLGDRIAIMSAGRVVCCGSSVFLNNLFGSGYKLRVECKMSRRAQILNQIRVHFKEARPAEDEVDTHRLAKNDPTVDFVVELKTASSIGKGGANVGGGIGKDVEMKMIELLEDFEKNKEHLGIESYGLKGSSIEEVMLHTGEFFARGRVGDKEASTKLTIGTIGNHLEVLARSKPVSPIRDDGLSSCGRILQALWRKQFNIYRANLFTVLIIKVLLPIMGSYDSVSGANKPQSSDMYWQHPLNVIMVGHFIYFPISERVSKFKIMQLDSDMSSCIYWLSWVVFDLLAVLVCVLAVNVLLLTTLEVVLLVPRWQLHGLITCATIMFCIASMMFCYLLSNIFSDPRTAYGYIFLLYFLSTIAYTLVFLYRLSLMDRGAMWLQNAVDYIGIVLLPGDAYQQVFVGLSTRCYVDTGIAPNCTIVAGNSPVSIGFGALLAQTMFYALLLGLVEMQVCSLEWYMNFKNLCCCFYTKQAQTFLNTEQMDLDVQHESTKALMAIRTSHDRSNSLVAAKLDKSYDKTARIIRELSFTVQRGECFGLLGVNGAGKSTTFSMIAGESRADSGRLLADGHYQHQELERYRQKFGYDPQSNPDLSLTPHEAFRLMARLRGVKEARIEALISALLDLLDMVPHQHKLDSELSGGTKRKLALGMALIGNPNLLALDEPTAGVDPLARRGVWLLLKSLRTQSNVSIIISSHAMEECEAICDRISIMARGRLRCIGTFLHLRSKFAKGCTLRIQFPQVAASRSDSSGNKGGHSSRRLSGGGLTEAAVHELQELLTAAVGPSVFKLADRNVNSVTFDITDNRVRRSILFRMMRKFRQRHPQASYVLNDSSLEDIFISLAKEQQEIERRNQ